MASTTIDASDKLAHFGYYRRALSSRRRSTIRARQSTAHEFAVANELPAAPKSVELEQRLARLEICCRDMQRILDLLARRFTAVQAELDHLVARMTLLK
jgi:hypothetical protein